MLDSCQGIHQNVRFRVEKVLVIHSFHQASEHQCERRWLGLRGKKHWWKSWDFEASADRDLPGCPVIPKIWLLGLCLEHIVFFGGLCLKHIINFSIAIPSFRNIWPKPRSSKITCSLHGAAIPPPSHSAYGAATRAIVSHHKVLASVWSFGMSIVRKYVPFQSRSSIRCLFLPSTSK